MDKEELKPINQLTNEIITKFRNYYGITGTKSTESLPEILTWLDRALMDLYDRINLPTPPALEALDERLDEMIVQYIVCMYANNYDGMTEQGQWQAVCKEVEGLMKEIHTTFGKPRSSGVDVVEESICRAIFKLNSIRKAKGIEEIHLRNDLDEWKKISQIVSEALSQQKPELSVEKDK